MNSVTRLYPILFSCLFYSPFCLFSFPPAVPVIVYCWHWPDRLPQGSTKASSILIIQLPFQSCIHPHWRTACHLGCILRAGIPGCCGNSDPEWWYSSDWLTEAGDKPIQHQTALVAGLHPGICLHCMKKPCGDSVNIYFFGMLGYLWFLAAERTNNDNKQMTYDKGHRIDLKPGQPRTTESPGCPVKIYFSKK